MNFGTEYLRLDLSYFHRLGRSRLEFFSAALLEKTHYPLQFNDILRAALGYLTFSSVGVKGLNHIQEK